MLALLLSSSIAFRREDPDAFLNKIRIAYSGVHLALFYVKFTATDPSGKKATGEVRYEFKAPNFFRGAFKGTKSGVALLLCDGKNIAVFGSNGRRQMFPFSTSALSSHIPTNVETLAFINSSKVLSKAPGGEMSGSDLTLVESKVWNSKSWTILRETNTQDHVQVDYFVDPSTHLIWRTLGQDLNTHKPFIDAQVTELVTDLKLDVNRFKIPSKIL
jgi:hypothetical protein